MAKLKEVGSTVGAEKTLWTSHPNMVDTSTVMHGLSVLTEEALEFMGSKVCLDGNARHAAAHRSVQANKCLATWRTHGEPYRVHHGSGETALEHREIDIVASFSVERVDDGEWWRT